MARFTKKEVTELLANPAHHWPRFQKLVRLPPPGHERAIVATVARWLGGRYAFGRAAKLLPASLIRLFLELPLPAPALLRPAATARIDLVFLKQAVPPSTDDDVLVAAWQAAVQALVDVQSYGWGSKQRRAKVAAVARTPHLVEAAQAAIVAAGEFFDDELGAVLALDGSEASADALLPHFDRAVTNRTGLESIDRLRSLAASTAPIQAMLRKVAQLLGDRSARSPAWRLSEALGIPLDGDAVFFHLSLRSTATGDFGEAIVQGSISVDSRTSPWLSVYVSGRYGTTMFDDEKLTRDDLGVGRTELTELPQFVARVATKLGITWSWEPGFLILSSLRAKKRTALTDWLRSKSG